MKPTYFPEHNIVFAKDQPEYLPLPAHRTNDGIATSCWQLSLRERIKLILGHKLWITQWTFRNNLQPILPRIARRMP